MNANVPSIPLLLLWVTVFLFFVISRADPGEENAVADNDSTFPAESFDYLRIKAQESGRINTEYQKAVQYLLRECKEGRRVILESKEWYMVGHLCQIAVIDDAIRSELAEGLLENISYFLVFPSGITLDSEGVLPFYRILLHLRPKAGQILDHLRRCDTREEWVEKGQLYRKISDAEQILMVLLHTAGTEATYSLVRGCENMDEERRALLLGYIKKYGDR